MENSKKFADMYQRMISDFTKVAETINSYAVEIAQSEDIKKASKQALIQSVENILDEMNKIVDKMEKIGKVK